jgi:small-conductance mechanosensitive channel
VVVLAGLAALLPAGVAAQALGTAAADSAAAAAESAPVPFRTSEIASESDALEPLLRSVARELEPGPPVERVLAGMDDRARRIEQERHTTERHLTMDLPEQIHAEQRHRWEQLTAQLDRDGAILASHVARLEELRDQLRRRAARWRTTRDRVVAEGLPAVTVSAVVENLQDLEAMTRRLVARRDAVLAAQARLGELRRISAGQRARVEDWLEEHAARLLNTRREPLWRVLDQQLAGRLLLDRLALLAHAYLDLLGRQPNVWLPAVTLRLGVLVVLIWLAWRLRRRVQARAPDDPDLQPAHGILQRPVSAAALVFLMSIILLDPLATRLVTEALVILALAPLLRIVARVTAPDLRHWLSLLAGLYLLWRLVGLAPDDQLLHRLLLLFTGLAAFGLVLGFRRALRRPAPGREPDTPAWLIDRADLRRPFVSSGLAVAAVLLVVAVVLNVLGLAAQARILTRGVVVGILIAVLLRVLVLVVRSLLTVLLGGRLARRPRILVRHGAAIRAGLGRALALVAWAAWLAAALELFGIWQPVSRLLVGVLFATLQVRDISISLADVVAFFGVIWLSSVLSRWLRALLEEEVLPRLALPRGVPNTMSRVTHYVVLFVGFLFAVNLAGFDLDRFTLLVGAFGVGIGFGLQNVVNNFISGLILLFERPVQVSDRVQVGAMLGFIEHIGIRASVIRTFEGAEVIVPNGQLISDVVTNWTLSDRMRRIDIDVGVAYGTDPQRVLGILREVAVAHPDVLADPAPYVLFMAFGESSLDFSLRAWTSDYEEFLRVGSELRVQIWHALKEAGIEIPFPQRDLHLRSGGLPAPAPRPDGEAGPA